MDIPARWLGKLSLNMLCNDMVYDGVDVALCDVLEHMWVKLDLDLGVHMSLFLQLLLRIRKTEVCFALFYFMTILKQLRPRSVSCIRNLEHVRETNRRRNFSLHIAFFIC